MVTTNHEVCYGNNKPRGFGMRTGWGVWSEVGEGDGERSRGKRDVLSEIIHRNNLYELGRKGWMEMVI